MATRAGSEDWALLDGSETYISVLEARIRCGRVSSGQQVETVNLGAVPSVIAKGNSLARPFLSEPRFGSHSP